MSDAFRWKFCVFHQKLSNNRTFFFFYIKKKKISKIQLGKLGQSTSVYSYFYAILQRAAFWKINETKPNQQTNTKNNPQISRTSGLLTFIFSFILRGEETWSRYLCCIIFSMNGFDCLWSFKRQFKLCFSNLNLNSSLLM